MSSNHVWGSYLVLIKLKDILALHPYKPSQRENDSENNHKWLHQCETKEMLISCYLSASLRPYKRDLILLSSHPSPSYPPKKSKYHFSKSDVTNWSSPYEYPFLRSNSPSLYQRSAQTHRYNEEHERRQEESISQSFPSPKKLVTTPFTKKINEIVLIQSWPKAQMCSNHYKENMM